MPDSRTHGAQEMRPASISWNAELDRRIHPTFAAEPADNPTVVRCFRTEHGSSNPDNV